MDPEAQMKGSPPAAGAPARPSWWPAWREAARTPRGVAALGQASIGFLLSSLGPCLVLLSRDLAVPRGRLSWVSGGFGAGLLLVGLTGERLLRLGTWRMVRISAVAVALGGLLLALAFALPLAQAGALVLGIGAAGVVLVCPVILAGPGAAAQLTFATAVSSVAGIVSPLLLSAAEASLGHGRLALLLPVPALLWLATTRRPASLPAQAAAPARPRARLAGRSRLAAARAWVTLMFAVSPEFFFVVWGAARMQDSGLGPAGAAAGAAAFPVGMALGRLLVPRLIGRLPVVAAGVALALAGALLCAAPVGPALATAALALAGLGISPLYPMLADQLMRTPGLDLGRGSALAALGSGVAVLGAPLALNALASAVTLRLGFLAAVPLLLLVLVLRRRERLARAQGAGMGSPSS
jgi:hypothetical protein